MGDAEAFLLRCIIKQLQVQISLSSLSKTPPEIHMEAD